MIIGSIYGPNDNDLTFYNNLKNSINDLNLNLRRPVIIGGDWNATFDLSNPTANLDILNMRNIPSRLRSEKIHEICTEFDLTDPFRTLYPFRKDFTYLPAAELRENRSRLDFFLVSSYVIPKCKKCDISPGLESTLFDHKAIYLTFKQKVSPQNFPVKNSILQDLEVNSLVKISVTECYIQHLEINNTFTNMQKNELLLLIGTNL